MNGVDIIGAILTADAEIVAKVPVAQIKAGALPEDAPLPSLLVRSISEVERQKLRRIGSVMITERIEVTVRAASYRDARIIREMVRDACAGRVGPIAGVGTVSVSNSGGGPDLIGPNNSYERGQDFRVSYEIQA
ncbi:hypothetical protein [Sphingomonas sp. MMS24-J13]|uniref:hypothetical protein n=1 Tax=Sphingomonas sp. MMS24-J13 TaxID=3238686 RepID=UPI00384F241E